MSGYEVTPEELAGLGNADSSGQNKAQNVNNRRKNREVVGNKPVVIPKEILTTENIFTTGHPITPILSLPRKENYKKYEAYYSHDYVSFQIIVRATPTGIRTANEMYVPINLYRLVTKRYTQLLLKEYPKTNIKDNDAGHEVLLDFIEENGFWTELKKALTDYFAKGDGLLQIYKRTIGAGVEHIIPDNWYKIVDPMNPNRITCHVTTNHVYTDEKNSEGLLTVVYHYAREKGKSFNKTVVSKTKSGIIKEVVTEVVEETGLSSFDIIHLKNDGMNNPYGLSTFKVIEDIVHSIEKGVTGIQAVYDKFFNPILSVSRRVLSADDMGQGTLNEDFLSGIHVTHNDEKDPKYITWDGQVETYMKFVDMMVDYLCMQTGLTKTFLFGQVIGHTSGETVKANMLSTILETGDIVDTIGREIKALFRGVLELEGVLVRLREITVEWQDGITESDEALERIAKMKAERCVSLVTSGIMSLKTVLKDEYNKNDLEADEEMARIKEEKNLLKSMTEIK